MNPNLILRVSFAAALMGAFLRAEAQAPATATPAPAGAPAAKAALTKTELRKLIENTEWVAATNEDNHYYFHRDGKFMGNWGKFYTVEAPNILKLYSEDPARNRKAEFAQFRINVAAMVAEFDREASSHGGKPMRYVGPIVKK